MPELPHAQPLAREVVLEDLAVPDDQDGLAFDHLAEAGKAIVQLVEGPIEEQDHGGREQAADQGHVLADHRVLDGVGDDEEHDQVEGRELAGLPLADDAEEDDQDDVDDRRADRDADEVRAEVGDRHHRRC